MVMTETSVVVKIVDNCIVIVTVAVHAVEVIQGFVAVVVVVVVVAVVVVVGSLEVVVVVAGMVVEDVTGAVGGGTVPNDGDASQVLTRNPCRKAARPSGCRASRGPGGNVPTVSGKYQTDASQDDAS